MKKIPEEEIDHIKKMEILINRIFLILIVIVTFFLGRYSVPIEREIDAGFMLVDDKQDFVIQELIDEISRYDEINIDNDLSRLAK